MNNEAMSRAQFAGLALLAAFLIVYHLSRVWLQLSGADVFQGTAFVNGFKDGFEVIPVVYAQVLLRVLIAASLLAVIFRKRGGIIGMWLSIGGLVATQFLLAQNAGPEVATLIPGGLTPLRGLVIPALISVLAYRANRPKLHT